MFRILRWLVILFIAFVVVIALLADFGVRRAAEAALAEHARQSTRATSASATLGGFPFLYEVLADGSVASVDLTLNEVPAGGLTIESVHVHLVKVDIDKSELIHQRKVTIRSIASGTASVTLTAPELSAATGQTVTLTSAGQVMVGVGGREVPATASVVAGDVLEIKVSGLPLITVHLSGNPIVPECSFSLVVTGSGVTASCTMTPVPPAVIAAISQQAA